MMPLTVQTICAAVGGTVLQSSGAAVRDVTTDSRRVPQEALFIPLVGERFDGHAYIEKALEAGAAGCLTAKTPEALLPGKFYIQVPDTRLALKALTNYLEFSRRLLVVHPDERALFVNVNGDRMTRQGFWKLLKQYAESAKIYKDITPHTLRHSFAAHLLENGADIHDIKEILGHADISSTQRYAQFLKDKMKNGYMKFHPRA